MVSNSNTGKALIYSEDKDFFQMLKYPRIDFYRPVAKKWVTMDSQDMDKWLVEHVCLGDDTDNINKIVDNINFSDSFKAHLQSFGLNDIEDIKQFFGVKDDKTLDVLDEIGGKLLYPGLIHNKDPKKAIDRLTKL